MIHIENITINIQPPSTESGPTSDLGDALMKAVAESLFTEQGPTPDPEEIVEKIPPRIGEYWPGQGGFYAGDFRSDDGRIYRLIVADCDVGTAKWGPEGACNLSQCDGKANTRALDDKYPAAKLAANHTADEHQDFYLPSRRELQLAAANVPHLFGGDGWYWSSTPRTESYAWAVDFESGSTDRSIRDIEFRVRPFRSFPDPSL